MDIPEQAIPPLLRLPLELRYEICSYLSAFTLLHLSHTCRALKYELESSDFLLSRAYGYRKLPASPGLTMYHIAAVQFASDRQFIKDHSCYRSAQNLPPLLALPVELRLEIYSFCTAFSLLHLSFVCCQLRFEITNEPGIYTTSYGYAFPDCHPQRHRFINSFTMFHIDFVGGDLEMRTLRRLYWDNILETGSWVKRWWCCPDCGGVRLVEVHLFDGVLGEDGTRGFGSKFVRKAVFGKARPRHVDLRDRRTHRTPVAVSSRQFTLSNGKPFGLLHPLEYNPELEPPPRWLYRRSNTTPILDLPLDLHFYIFRFCSAFALLQLSATCTLFRSEITSTPSLFTRAHGYHRCCSYREHLTTHNIAFVDKVEREAFVLWVWKSLVPPRSNFPMFPFDHPPPRPFSVHNWRVCSRCKSLVYAIRSLNFILCDKLCSECWIVNGKRSMMFLPGEWHKDMRLAAKAFLLDTEGMEE
ncbi:hypothetical protein BJ508DRAFT_326817 [Ascobolus immersus RN42]|uniref:F-box domain-containing protein n=1 Tax=Ascobolus immersus RN42 TaxID=1160509 RepID=A0A3N4I8K0_ASCIM|nr:hypothetical protein BJ508DRAFT_326817 [Ascobolus immersus RN42]